MKQEEIVNEIRQVCGQTILMPSLGWHFKYNGQVYFYVVGKDEGMIRFCIPFVAGLPSQDRELLKEAVNDTNRNVKYIKAMLSEKNEVKVSLEYDHKVADNESAKEIVPHIIKALDFAVGYFKERVREKQKAISVNPFSKYGVMLCILNVILIVMLTCLATGEKLVEVSTLNGNVPVRVFDINHVDAGCVNFMTAIALLLSFPWCFHLPNTKTGSIVCIARLLLAGLDVLLLLFMMVIAYAAYNP